MSASATRVAMRAFGLLPEAVRQRIVRLLKPSYTVGAGCLIERGDEVLLVQTAYRRGWGMPGGLLNRRENPADGARREVREELGLDVALLDDPIVVIDRRMQKIDIVYRATAEVPDDLAQLRPSAEITAVRWFHRDALPPLQPEAIDAIATLSDDDHGADRLRIAGPRSGRPGQG